MYFFAYAGMQIPVGILMDRYGTRNLLTIAGMIVTFGCVLFASAQDLYIAGLGRFLMGLGSAFAFVGCLKVSANWFPPSHFAFIVGLTNMVGVLGVVLGEPYLSTLVQLFDWREAIYIAAGLGLICTVLLYSIIREGTAEQQSQAELEIPSQTQVPSQAQSKNPSGSELWRALIGIVRKPQSWLVAIYAGLMVAPIVGFAEQWSVAFIQELFPISKPNATALSEMIFVGIAIGGLVHGWMSGYLGRRKPIMFYGAVGAFLSLVSVLYTPITSQWHMGALLFALGFFSSSMLLGFAANCELNVPQVRGTVVGFTNMCVMAGGAVFQPLLGKLLDVYWEGQTIAGARHFSIYDFHMALAVLPVCQLLAFFLVFFIRETHCQQQLK